MKIYSNEDDILRNKMKRKIIALLSPSKNAYSETFIQAHKNYFDAEVKYYYNGYMPTCQEGLGNLKPSLFILFYFFIRYFFFKEGNSILQYLVLKASFKKNKIEKVYAEYGPVAASVLDVCKKLNLPLIVNFHGYDISKDEILNKYKDAYLELFDYAQFIVAVSKEMEKTLIKMGADSKKIIYTPCAPSDVYFGIEPKYDGDYFVSTGRFVDKKAPYYTILAFKKVLKKHPNAKLYISGDGPLLNSCLNLIKYYNLKNSIFLIGVTDQDKLIELYKNAVGYIQHSIISDDGDMEGTPVSILEASASGLPVVSTFHAGIKDVIINGETGLLVNEHDVDQMAENIEKIYLDRNIAKSLGQAGRVYIKENFSMEKHINILNNLIYE
jgi:glycosyltransferase involved in cell wall biosynthesis